MELDPAICERARLSRDPRFDGRFFVAVVTTGIYCRPICPVRPPKPENVRFMSSAAAAAEAGFRPCLRCRPEASPGTPAWLGTSASVSRALRLIGDGVLDSGSVDDLAAKLGIGSRHLHRLFIRHLGASPASVAQTRRLNFAKKLLDETQLPMARVALAAGFGSLRRFNSVVRDTYDRSPSQLRMAARRSRGALAGDAAGFRVRLQYRPPFDWEALVAFFALRAIPGIESVNAQAYRRTIRIERSVGVIEVVPVAGEDSVSLRVCVPDSVSLLPIAERVRRIFDLGADPVEICGQLAQDPLLAERVAARPGLRVPGAWDPFESCVRTVVGQQVSERSARTLLGRVAERCGERHEASVDTGLGRVFPTSEQLIDADLSGLGMTRTCERTIRELALAFCSGNLRLDEGLGLEERIASLCAIPGVGSRAAQYVAMRAFGEPDAFPVGDPSLAIALARPGAPALGPGAVCERAERWRPWRAYAAMHLGSSPASDAIGCAEAAVRSRGAVLEARS